MMQSLEVSCGEGERAVKRLKALRSAAPSLASPKEESQASFDFGDEKGAHPPLIDIFAELEKLYDQEDGNENDEVGVQYKSLLLEKIVAREKLNTVILNLYPGNKGYSLAFQAQPRKTGVRDSADEMIETKPRPYEDDHLLRYLDLEELPPFVLDVLEQFEHLFYSGCVVAEVRDYRQAYPHTKCDVHHVLLRPTHKSLLADINNLMKERPEFTAEDRDYLESQLLLAHSPDLCLDPDPHIENEMAQIHNTKQLWNTHKFRRIARKFSQVTVNCKRKLDHLTHRHGLDLLEFVRSKKSRTAQAPYTGRSIRKVVPEESRAVPVPSLECPPLPPPAQPMLISELRPLSWPEETSDCSPMLMEEYILETDMPSKDKDQPRVYHIKLSIFQRPSNLEYLGELYLDRDHKKDERNGVACRFSLGSRPNAHRYVRQFTEIFTESGRKAARIRCGLSGGARAEAQGASRGAHPHPRDHLDRLGQALQAQPQQTQPAVNGAVQSLQAPSHVQILPQKLQQISSQELEINALATKLMNSAQQFQAAANAKQQAAAQQQKFLSNSNIINLLNSSPASSANSDASAAVVNAINAPQQRLLARKMTLSNVTGGARVLNHTNLIALNNNRVNLGELSAQLSQGVPQTVTLTSVNNNRVNLGELSAQLGQSQAVTLTSVNSGSYNYTAVPLKQQVVNQRIVSSSSAPSEGNKSALSALLVGTPAADRPDIVGPNTNSLLLEKLAGAAAGQGPFGQSPKAQFVVQSPKGNAVISPLNSPPPTAQATGVQSLSLAQLQGIPGLQNVQVQLPGFAQPISLALNVSGGGAGGGQGLLVSLPTAAAATQTQAAPSQATQQQLVLANAGPSQLAHLVSSGSVKGLSHPNLRAASSGPQTVSIAQGSPQFQLISQLQRPNRQQTGAPQANLASRTLQRTPITIKMAPNSSQLTDIQFNFDN